jgi:hypothetical protein
MLLLLLLLLHALRRSRFHQFFYSLDAASVLPNNLDS